MVRYFAVRVGQGLVALILVSMVVFALARSTGDPAALMLPPNATDEQVERMHRHLGLDKSLPEQYGRYLGNAVQGDLGTSIRYEFTVSELLGQRLPASLILAATAMGGALIATLTLGTLGAMTRRRWLDSTMRIIAVLGLSLPSFWVGLMLISFFAVDLGWLPAAGRGGIDHLVLPAITLGLFVTGGMMRLLRAGMHDVLPSPYVRAARMRGLPERRITRVYVLRNAIIPVLAFAGVYFPLMISSAIVVETVFTWPGIGSLAYDSVVSRDFPVVQGVALIGSLLFVVVALVVDLLHMRLDPRLRSHLVHH